MSSTIGNVVKYSLFGESHGPAIGMTISGLPAGLKLDDDVIDSALKKRKTGGRLTSARREADRVEWLSGLYNGHTSGAPLTFIIKNDDQRSADYEMLKDIMRPSHADYSAHLKYDGFNDPRGGGMFSGRLTACYVVAGSIVRQLLERLNIEIRADIVQLGRLKIPPTALLDRSVTWLDGLNEDYKVRTTELLQSTIRNGDSLGGRVRVVVNGLPAGVGEPHFNNLESVLAQYLYAVPGLKSLGFGDAEQFAEKVGSAVADCPLYVDGHLTHDANHNGGVLGGISNGMPLTLDCVFKATPSLRRAQTTADIAKRTNVSLSIGGRHDPAFVVRTPIVVESVVAMAIYDLMRLGNLL